MKILALVAPVAFVGACALGGHDADPSLEQESGSTRYVEISELEGFDQDQWFEVERALNQQFDDICGDTFCEGEYTNITPLSVACAVTSKSGKIKDCAWTFAASTLDVDARTAALVVDAPTFECHFQAATTARTLSNVLAASSESLYEPLPGAPSIYDQIGECFENPIGQTPGVFAETGRESYVSTRDFYTGAGIDRWYAARQALFAGFDRVCGDTFCGGDFGDLQSLDLQCAVTKSTGNVKTCAWVFGGSYFLVPERAGTLDATHRTFRCEFDVAGTLPQLIDTLTAPGPTDAIRRPLPGLTTSAYDALAGGCLR
jgi:hypothetical protein